MDNLLIKPYEISVWEDVYDNGLGRFVENKLAIIGSNTMTGLNAIYNPVFHKKLSGEKTLSFSLKYKYYDPFLEKSEIVNPFVSLLINERKIKLHYDNQWYEFIIKDHTESSDGLEWTYVCNDAFILELSKNGYNLTFDSELNNNQGTAKELATKTLENTDWKLGEVDNLKQYIAEPIYKAVVKNNSLTIINVNGTEEEFSSGDIYLFYSFVKNQSGQYVQFIIRDENRAYTIDDNNVITDTNFRILDTLEYKESTINNNTIRGFYKDNVLVIELEEVETRFQANRLAYNQLTTYDPVMERTVDRFGVQNGQNIEDREIYRYTDFIYTTSNVVTNYITNGDNFNVLEDGSLQGWSPYVKSTTDYNKLELVTRPELAIDKALADLSVLSQIDGFLKVTFNKGFNSYQNGIYNSGADYNGAIIKTISKGEKFVFRYRAATGNLNSLQPMSDLRLVVAKYTNIDPERGYTYKEVDSDNIILDFRGTPQDSPNIIEGGEVVNNSYIIDGVEQVISTKYLYKNSSGILYAWNTDLNQLKPIDETNYLPYYYLVATAQQSISNQELIDPTNKFGVFLYYDGPNPSNEHICYIQDIQLTRFIENTDGTPILLGNVPEAKTESIDYYYLKPADGALSEEITTFRTIDSLKEEYNISAPRTVVPLYNENSEKTLTISVSQSNCFNILQTIAETFQCWVDIEVEHDKNGYITYTNNKPNKFIYLREFAGKDNYAGFKYGVNINAIERTVNSEEFVTKLIVDSTQSDYTDEGYVSITTAPSNNSRESYILNFEYYYNQGILDRDIVEADKVKFITDVAQKNAEIVERQNEYNSLAALLNDLNSQRNIYTELIDTANASKTQAIKDFEELTKKSYEEYRIEHPTLDKNDQLIKEETILKILGKLYTSSATINNYSGVLTNINSKYWETRKKIYGSENYNIKIWVGRDSAQIRHVYIDVSDYLDGLSILIDGITYSVTLNQKYFDIITNASQVDFSYSKTNYTFEPTNSYIIDDNVTTRIILKANTSVEGILDKIDKLLDEKRTIVNNFNNKYSRFLQEGTWSSTDYIDSELYYLNALQVSNTSAQPLVSYNINVVEISELENYKNYNFDIGDKTYIEDTEFFGWATVNGVLTPAREEVIVSEIEWHLDVPEENIITVQNYKTRFEDLFQRISATVQTVQYNEATYAKISSLIDNDGTINQNVLLESLNNISGQPYSLTSDGSVLIDGENILIRNLTNASNFVKINSEGIRVSSDGGQSWTTAIDGHGINVDTVYTGILNTDTVIIGNRNYPSFRWDRSGISAYGSTTRIIDGIPTQSYNLKQYVRFDEYGLYGIKNNSTFKAESIDDVKNNAHFAVTWDGFFIRNSYPGGGRVEITSDNDFRILKKVQNDYTEKIKIGALEWQDRQGNIYTDIQQAPEEAKNAGPSLYGIRIKDKNDEGYAFKADDQGNLEVTGTINATAGNFSGLVQVGTGSPYIAIDGEEASIKTSNYQDGASLGWKIDKDGNAVFNNITARGAIKTAVFEYAEIQAVGGIFLFRPSSTIKSATIASNTQDLIVTVEKPLLFKEGSWCKISNYASGENTAGSEAISPDIVDILTTNGLTYVYPISQVVTDNGITYITLSDAAAMLEDIDRTVDSLVGGALIDMGNREPINPTDPESKLGTNNYGIGINSSDNTVDLPARAISLFETKIDNEASAQNPKITYEYQAILGTLPELSYQGNDAVVSNLYHKYLANTQGLYTDNIYLGDDQQYLTFYTDGEGNKKLCIKAAEIFYELNGDYVNVNSPAKYIWYDNVGGHVASGVPDGTGGMIPFDSADAETFGYNALMATDRLSLRYNDKEFVYIDTEGLKINSADGKQIAKYGDSIILGDENTLGVYVEIDDSGLSFKSQGKKISYLDSRQLYIPYSVVLNEMVVGSRNQNAMGIDSQSNPRVQYKRTNDDIVMSENGKTKDYFTKQAIKENNVIKGYTFTKAIIDPNVTDYIPSSLKWFEIDTSDLWAWKVGQNEHLKLVWKGASLRHELDLNSLIN